MIIFFWFLVLCTTFVLATPLHFGFNYVSTKKILNLEIGIWNWKYKKTINNINSSVFHSITVDQYSDEVLEHTEEETANQNITSTKKKKKGLVKRSINTLTSKAKDRMMISKKDILTHSVILVKNCLNPLKLKEGHLYVVFGLNNASQTGTIQGVLYSIIGLFDLANKKEFDLEFFPCFEQSKFDMDVKCIIQMPLGHIISIFFYSVMWGIKVIKKRHSPISLKSANC